MDPDETHEDYPTSSYTVKVTIEKTIYLTHRNPGADERDLMDDIIEEVCNDLETDDFTSVEIVEEERDP